MADDKNLRGPRDRNRINPNEEEYEVRHAAEEFGVSKEELLQAIEQVGDNREKVQEYLRSKSNR